MSLVAIIQHLYLRLIIERLHHAVPGFVVLVPWPERDCAMLAITGLFFLSGVCAYGYRLKMSVSQTSILLLMAFCAHIETVYVNGIALIVPMSAVEARIVAVMLLTTLCSTGYYVNEFPDRKLARMLLVGFMLTPYAYIEYLMLRTN
jgi:hypothetical protein